MARGTLIWDAAFSSQVILAFLSYNCDITVQMFNIVTVNDAEAATNGKCVESVFHDNMMNWMVTEIENL